MTQPPSELASKPGTEVGDLAKVRADASQRYHGSAEVDEVDS